MNEWERDLLKAMAAFLFDPDANRARLRKAMTEADRRSGVIYEHVAYGLRADGTVGKETADNPVV